LADQIEGLRAALAGRYAIEREVGAGGMAVVYLARDLKHDRRVALKVLKDELGAVLGVERFLAEIKVTANLQHPNLLPLFDSGEAAGLLFYVMPFVEGESLRARLARETLLPVDEAIRIAVALAGALDYAHRQDVVHRDLKPENILLHEGQPLIADFGIALAVSNAGGARITQTGLSLGTPQYMSPEQATGERMVDRRSDIYSLAAVTYELLTGEPPHTGATAQAIIGRVLTANPRSIRESRDTVPEYVDLAIARGLAKLPADRWPTAREFGDALTNPTAMSKTAAIFGVASRASVPMRRLLPWALALAGAAATGLLWSRGEDGDATSAVVRFPLTFDPGVEVITARGSPFALSPDGTLLAFAATTQGGSPRLFLRRLDELEAREIPGTEEAQQPFFSPDGIWIGYYARQELRKVPADGGASVPIGDVPVQIHGASWGSRGEIVFASDGVLRAIPAAGGKPRTIATPDSAAGEILLRFPHLLADGQTILYESWPKEGLAGARIGAVSIDGSNRQVLDLAGASPLGVVDGYLVYAAPVNTIMAVPFDERRAVPTGVPTVVVDGAVVGTAGALKGAVSRNGSLVYASSRTEAQLVLTDGRGPARVLLADPRSYAHPRFSPDGRRVALTVMTATGADIHLLDLASGALSRLTSEGRSNDHAEWSPDGKRVLFTSNRGGPTAIWWQAADLSSSAELLFGAATMSTQGGVVAPDGRTVVARGTGDLLWSRSLAGDTAAKVLLGGTAPQYAPRISPDGRWIAYSSSDLGRRQVFVSPISGPGPRLQVSPDGESDPIWSRDGRRLYYVHSGQLMAATLAPGPQLSVTGRTVALDKGAFDPGLGFHANYDVSPDGTQFLTLRPVGGDASLILVHNWKHELRTRMAANIAK
jgi:serine/threonine-protein kinase